MLCFVLCEEHKVDVDINSAADFCQLARSLCSENQRKRAAGCTLKDSRQAQALSLQLLYNNIKRAGFIQTPLLRYIL